MKNKKINWLKLGLIFWFLGLISIMVLFSLNINCRKITLRYGLRCPLYQIFIYIAVFLVFFLSFISFLKALKRIKDKDIVIIILTIIFLFSSILILIGLVKCVFSKDLYNIDTKIKSSLSELRAGGELYKENKGNYSGFCDNIESFRFFQEVSNRLYCKDNEKEWAACAQLVSDTNKYLCVDLKGRLKEITGNCNQSWNYTVCP